MATTTVGKLRTVLGLDSSKFASGAKRAKRQSSQLSRSLEGVGKAAKRIGVALATAFAVRGISQAVGLAANFEKTMSGVEAVTGATAKEMENLTAKARELGGSTAFSASEAAAGIEFLGRAGFSTNQILESVESTLNLAAAGGLELARAADISSNVLTAFNLEAKEMGRVTDVMAATAASANTDIEQFGEGIKLVAPIAAALGVEIEETSAAIGVLSNAGLQATLAGTGLRAVMIELANPTEKLKKFLGDASLQTNTFTELLQILVDKGIDPATDGIEIFGKRGGPAFAVLAKGADDVSRLTDELQDASGAAKEMADVRLKNLSGETVKLKSALSELILVLDEQSGLTKWLTEAAKASTELVQSFLQATAIFTKIAGDDSLAGMLQRVSDEITKLQEKVRFRGILGLDNTELEQQIESLNIARQAIIDTARSAGRIAPKLEEAKKEAKEITKELGKLSDADVEIKFPEVKAGDGGRIKELLDDAITPLQKFLADKELLEVELVLTQDPQQRAKIQQAIDNAQEQFDSGLDLEFQFELSQTGNFPKARDIRKEQLEVLLVLMGQARDVFNSVISPAEAFLKTQTKLEELYRAETISLETHNRALQQAEIDFENAKNKGSELSDEMKNVRAQIESLAGSISNRLTTAFADALDGAKSFGESFIDILKLIRNEIIRVLVVQKLIGSFANADGSGGGGLLGAIGGAFASGGRPPVGVPSIVGERGPELFVPQSAGTIIPNSDLALAGGGTTMNFDLRGVKGSREVEEAVVKGISQAAPALTEAAVSAVQDSRRRNPNFFG